MTEVPMVGATTPVPDSFQHRITAAFEAIMLIRCAQPGRGPSVLTRAASGRRLDGVFVEFSRLDAAQRLLALLHGLGYGGTQRVRTAGIREQHPIYQIVLAPDDRAAVEPILRTGWRTGLGLLCHLPGGYLTPRRRRHRDHLAVAAWRAAVLAAGYKRQRGHRGFYIGDSDTLAVLVRAGRVLDLNVTAQRRSGCHLVQVPEPDSVLATASGCGPISGDPQDSTCC